jgi:DNA-binding transcriptional regulator GbsR (MarR family)
VFSQEVTIAEQSFVEHWQEIGKHWGVPKAMLAVHAWLILKPQPQSTDDVMHHLNMSRGKRQVLFVAEKEDWAMMTAILRVKKRRELDPFLTLDDWREVHSEELSSGANDGLDARLKSWMVTAQKLDRLAHLASREDESWWRRWIFSALRTK